MIQSEQVEIAAKSKIRISIESLLIDLNEEIFAISEEVANSFQNDNTKYLVNQARAYEIRKKQLVKRVSATIEDDPIAKIVRREIKMSKKKDDSMNRSSSHGQSKNITKINSFAQGNIQSKHL